MAMRHVFIALSSHHPGITYRRGSVIERLERMRKAMGWGLCVTCCRVCFLLDVNYNTIKLSKSKQSVRTNDQLIHLHNL